MKTLLPTQLTNSTELTLAVSSLVFDKTFNELKTCQTSLKLRSTSAPLGIEMKFQEQTFPD